MAIKTFTTGSVLTAADTNTYLANSGLVFVKSQTVGTAVSSVTVSSAFSADYDNYRIIYTGGVMSANTNISMVLGATAIGYYNQLIYAAYAGTTVSANVPDNNAVRWNFVGAGLSIFARVAVELQNPFSTTRTLISSVYANDLNAGHAAGFLNDATSYTAFTLGLGTGTMTGGTITVYGYRKA